MSVDWEKLGQVISSAESLSMDGKLTKDKWEELLENAKDAVGDDEADQIYLEGILNFRVDV